MVYIHARSQFVGQLSRVTCLPDDQDKLCGADLPHDLRRDKHLFVAYPTLALLRFLYIGLGADHQYAIALP